MATPIDRQAQAQAQAALAPVLAEIERQKAEEDRRAENAKATTAASAQGLSQVLGGLPGQIQDTYKQAGDATSAYAKGFSAAFQQDSEQAASALNEFLQQQGSPQQVKAAGEAGADVLYGLGGFIPASALAREGAAFTSAAQGWGPGALARGQEQQALIGRESRSNIDRLNALIRQEKAKLPALAQEIARGSRAYELDVRQDKRAERELTLREKEANRPNSQLFGSAETGYMTFDSKTGKVVRLTDPLPPGASPPKLIGSSDMGYYAWDEANGTISPVLAPPKQPRFTQKEMREIKIDAANMAYDAFWGRKNKDGEYEADPMHYQQAMAWMLDQQIPLEIAQNALNKHWKKPGYWADRESRLAGNPDTVRWIDFKKQSAKGVTGRPLKPIQERKPAAQADAWRQYVGTPEKRRGPSQPHRPEILRFVGEVGMVAGTKLTPWGNESHSLRTVDGRPSAHATGRAADIPASGDELIRLGRAALVAAGMSPAEAAKAKGGIYNVGGKQIIFATNKGGNHFDHLHVGLRS